MAVAVKAERERAQRKQLINQMACQFVAFVFLQQSIAYLNVQSVQAFIKLTLQRPIELSLIFLAHKNTIETLNKRAVLYRMFRAVNAVYSAHSCKTLPNLQN